MIVRTLMKEINQRNQQFEINVIDNQGEIKNTMLLTQSISGKKDNNHGISLAHYCHSVQNHKKVRENRKCRAEVSGGGRKPRQQKGTGRARQGSIRAPQWVGGGLVWGPRGEKKHIPSINKKTKQKALQSILFRKIKNKEVVVVEKLEMSEYKTRDAVQLLKKLITTEYKSLLIIFSSLSKDKKTVNSFRNIERVTTINSNYLTVSQVLLHDLLIFTYDSFKELEKKELTVKN